MRLSDFNCEAKRSMRAASSALPSCSSSVMRWPRNGRGYNSFHPAGAAEAAIVNSVHRGFRRSYKSLRPVRQASSNNSIAITIASSRPCFAG